MLNTDFVSWLSGYLLLLCGDDDDCGVSCKVAWTSKHIEIVKAHLNLVFRTTGGKLTFLNFKLFHELATIPFDELRTLILHDFRLKPIISGSELSFFLQGYFEIGGEENVIRGFTLNQAEIITKEYQRNVDGLNVVTQGLYWDLQKFIDQHDQQDKYHGKKILFPTVGLAASLNTLFHHVVHIPTNNVHQFDPTNTNLSPPELQTARNIIIRRSPRLTRK